MLILKRMQIENKKWRVFMLNKAPYIHVPKEPPPFPKPFLGYRPGHGMPSAREPVEHYTDEGRKTFDHIFPEKKNKNIDMCNNKKCQYYSERKNNQCAMFNDINLCGEHK